MWPLFSHFYPPFDKLKNPEMPQFWELRVASYDLRIFLFGGWCLCASLGEPAKLLYEQREFFILRPQGAIFITSVSEFFTAAQAALHAATAALHLSDNSKARSQAINARNSSALR